MVRKNVIVLKVVDLLIFIISFRLNLSSNGNCLIKIKVPFFAGSCQSKLWIERTSLKVRQRKNEQLNVMTV